MLNNEYLIGAILWMDPKFLIAIPFSLLIANSWAPDFGEK